MKRFVLLGISALTLIIILTLSWFIYLNKIVTARLKERQFAPPIDLYSAPEKIIKGQRFPKGFFVDILKRHKYRERQPGQVLREADYVKLNYSQCLELIGDEIPSGTEECIEMMSRNSSFGPRRKSTHELIALNEEHVVLEVFEGEPLEPKLFIELEPELFAQFYGNTPILRHITTLKQTPVLCLNALLAIEDSSFLEHRGFSFTGIARAMWRNVKRGGIGEGGSTLTQQLVKNYFLTSERTLKRKITEIGMALILESHLDKDEILETYLNVIYMGQNGPFQVRGYGAAAHHYFSKELEELNLQECALLAAIVNGPGVYNPFTAAEKAKARRQKVLKRMSELAFINNAEADEADKTDLPKRPPEVLTETAPYFVDAVMNQMSKLKIDTEKGLRVYTTLNRRAQQNARKAVEAGLERLEKNYKRVKEQKAKNNLLETCLIAADPNSGFIQALVGGRGYKVSQFNRAISGHRQVGSIMKPLVYLSALESLTPEGNPYTPLTEIEDKIFTYKYEGQKWSPDNYDKKYRGTVPMFVALKDSLNAATAHLGIQIGLPAIVDVARRLGIDSKLLPLPSITLGAFELYPIEVLRAYTTLARQGSRIDLSFIRTVEDLQGNLLYAHHYTDETATSKENAAILVGMMKQTLQTGTGRYAKAYGFTHPAAGKTGTTSDTRDSWFAGFTPYHVAIVWVGYDNNEPHNLTGASGALPIWASYMRDYASGYPAIDFPIPDETINVDVPLPTYPEDKADNFEFPSSVTITFKRGTEPGSEGAAEQSE